MTIVSGVVDRTNQTRSITHSNQYSAETGERIGIFDGAETRPLANVDAIILHQTGYWQASRGNDVGAYDHTIAHFVILPNGTVLQIRDLEARLNSVSANYGLDIEVVGCFNSDRFDCETYRRNMAEGRERPRRCTPRAVSRSQAEVPGRAQIDAGRRLIAAITDHEAMPDQVHYILAHRQLSSLSRENCPGPHLWYNLGHWAVTRWRMSSSRHRRNRAIPPAWENPRFAIPLPCPPIRTDDQAGQQRLETGPAGVYAAARRRPGTTGMG